MHHPTPILYRVIDSLFRYKWRCLIAVLGVVLAVMEWLRSEGRLAERIDLQTMRELPARAGGPP